MEYVRSLTDLLRRVATRWYLIVLALIADPWDLLEVVTNREWPLPSEFRDALFGIALFLAVWLTYHDAWVKTRGNRLSMLLRLKREGQSRLEILRLLQQWIGSHSVEGGVVQGVEETVSNFKDVIEEWLSAVREVMTDGELGTFDRDRGGVNDIDIGLFTTIAGLGRYLEERVARLDDICEGIRYEQSA